jgi:RNA polymerase sigma-70 factor, ECF subfamily
VTQRIGDRRAAVRKRFRAPDPLADPKPLIRSVYAYAAYRLGDGPDAEDATSCALENAVRYRKSYNEVRGNPRVWLLGIARRCVAQVLAGKNEGLELPETASRDDLEAEALDRLSLQRALHRLDDRDRELIALRYGADLRTGEIGELLDLKANAVDVAMHRAVGRLRTALEQEGNAPEQRRNSM